MTQSIVIVDEVLVVVAAVSVHACIVRCAAHPTTTFFMIDQIHMFIAK